MADQYANCTVSHKMHADRRFDLLAELAGWSRPEACWRMVELWARCTALKTDRPPAEVIRIHLGIRGEQHLVDAVLAERMPDGGVRVLGGGLTGGDTDRFGWYEPIEQRNAAGGRARADQVRREGRAPGGKFAAAGSSVHQRPTSDPTSVTSDPPASTSNPPASGFRIPGEDQRLSPAHDPAVPSATPPPTAPAAPPGESAWHRRLRWWSAMLEADARIRAAGVEPNAPSLPRTCAGENEKNMNRCEQQLLAEGRTPAEVDAAMRHIVLVAEAEALAPHHRHRRWFKPALIWDPVRATRAVDTSLKEAGTLPPQKPRPARGDPLPPAPAPKRPERVPAPIRRTPEEIAELEAMAALAADNPRAACDELRNSGRLELARAPPRSSAQDPPDQQPQQKAAK